MGSIFLSNWKFGLDRRRSRVAGVQGSLYDAKNVLINRGGEIERAKRFVPTYTLPVGQTFGLGAVRGQLYTFGSVSNPTLPLGIQYQRLVSASGAAMTQVLDVRTAGASLYVIARYADGNTHHFYNGSRITDWDALGDANTDFPTTATYLAELISANQAVSAVAVGSAVTITALVPGTAFTISRATVNGAGGVNDQDILLTTAQPNVPALADVQAHSTVTFLAGAPGGAINDITVNGVSLMRAGVIYTTDNTTTMALIATQIVNKAATSGYSASAVAGVLTITAQAGTGATPNGFVVSGIVGGSVVLATPPMAGGVTMTAGVAQVITATLSGTFESKDQFALTVDGTTYATTGRAAGTGVSAYVVKRRVFSPASSLWEYCKLNTFTDWSDSTVSSGAGFLNISNEAEGSERLVGAGTYIQQSAIFSRRNIRVYNMDTDATKIILSQPIDNSGALSARSILAYGTTDLFYLDEPGIRSLKARDSSGEPFVNDIGIPIDPFVRAHLDTLSLATIQKACAIVEPKEGRFWLALDNRIYVLSYFPGSQISAWTYIEPGFSISDFARVYQQLYVRGGDTVYLYGGQNATTYPLANELTPKVDIPFVSGQPPGTQMMLGFDMAAQGEWSVKALVDPNNENSTINIGTLDGITYADSAISFPGRTTHVGFSMTSTAAGPASIYNLTVHTDGKEGDT